MTMTTTEEAVFTMRDVDAVAHNEIRLADALARRILLFTPPLPVEYVNAGEQAVLLCAGSCPGNVITLQRGLHAYPTQARCLPGEWWITAADLVTALGAWDLVEALQGPQW